MNVEAVIVGENDFAVGRCVNSLGIKCNIYKPNPRFVYTKVNSVNIGVAVITTQFCIIADGDSEFPKDYVKQCLEIASQKSRVIIGGFRDEIHEDGSRHPPYMGRSNSHDGPHVCGSFLFFQKQDWLMVGGYNPFMVHPDGWHTDVDFIVRMRKAGCELIMLPEHYAHYEHPFVMPTSEEQQINYKIAANSCYDGKKWRMKKCTINF